MPFPTPDPSASLTPWQSHVATSLGWFSDLGQLAYVAGVTALALLAFGVGVLVLTTLFRGH